MHLTNKGTKAVAAGLILAAFSLNGLAAEPNVLDPAHAQISEMAQKNAALIRADLEAGMATARTLAQFLGTLKSNGMTDRAVVNQALKQLLEANPNYLGTWTAWEPNAFDGKDEAFAGKEAHDKTGRFIPYWTRTNGQIRVDALQDYDKPGDGDYYQLPKTTGKEVILDPYEYPVNGKPILVTSLCVPIKVDGRFVGVAGIDFALKPMQEQVANIHPFNTGYASLIANNGKYIADADPANVGKPLLASENSVQEAIHTGRMLTSNTFDEHLKGKAYRVYAPVTVSQIGSPWSLAITVPANDL